MSYVFFTWLFLSLDKLIFGFGMFAFMFLMCSVGLALHGSECEGGCQPKPTKAQESYRSAKRMLIASFVMVALVFITPSTKTAIIMAGAGLAQSIASSPLGEKAYKALTMSIEKELNKVIEGKQ